MKKSGNQIRTFFWMLSFAILPLMAGAQNGEALFKAKCNSCHIMGKDGTGPNLQGVKAKWADEMDNLFE
jgi:cytochrome c2